MDLRQLFARDEQPRQGFLAFEWLIMAYVVFTSLLMLYYSFSHELHMASMVSVRLQTLAALFLLKWIYTLKPCRFTMFLRALAQLMLLGLWYPDTYELNRMLPNLDHVFAQCEQTVFGCQPALLFAQLFPQPLVSELVKLGYESYYVVMLAVMLYYLFKRFDDFERMAFILLGSFFLFYLVFIFLPVVGPQFYYCAVGVDQIAQGVFPNVGHYFENNTDCLPIPGWQDGLFHQLTIISHNAGERPTAAFPSSHVGVTTILLWLAWQARSRWLFFSLLPLAVLMFFGTFYILAHYAIDAIAGVFFGTFYYFLLRFIYKKSR